MLVRANESDNMAHMTNPDPVIFRSRADEGYAVWKDFRSLPIISVAPVRRPKLDEGGCNYSFAQEKDLMKEKMKTILRIAAKNHHSDLCLGAFGVGPSFRNPIRQVAAMWKEILFMDAEFQGVFSNIVFAIEKSAGTSSNNGTSDFDVFENEFDPSKIFQTAKRYQ